MKKHEALALLDAIVDDLSDSELFEDVGEAGFLMVRESLEITMLALQGRLPFALSHHQMFMEILSHQLAAPPNEHMN
ncbi:hypothetical protein [Herpetosiphon llansteffanensis]|uniref:hypothetical protein n=1 Tax=Herpetosiphon llansteffanensis TaxID=2094568 RepID=UPI000D7B9A0A|nr:hypothetical protein [Herpetosiphon llansteffanensis]